MPRTRDHDDDHADFDDRGAAPVRGRGATARATRDEGDDRDDRDDHEQRDDRDGYVRVAGRPNDQRRRRRAVLVIGGLVAFLVLALTLGLWWTSRSSGGGAATPAAPATSSCVPTPAPKPAQITVNVYNATSRSGIAAGAATTLKGQGFTVAAVKNDPLAHKVSATAEIRYGPTGAGAARVVAQRVSGAKLVADKRTDGSVDLVLGDQYTDVSSPLGGSSAPAPTC